MKITRSCAGSLLAACLLTQVAQAYPRIVACPDQAVRVGETATLTVTATGVPPFTYQWYRLRDPIPGATNASLTFSNATFADASDDYLVVVWDQDLTDDDWTVRLTVWPTGPIPGWMDQTYQAPVGGGTLVMQPNGQLLVGGYGVHRLWPDGSLDTNFVSTPYPDPVNKVVRQSDGKLVVANRTLFRLNADGTPDPSFVPVDFREGDPYLRAYQLTALAVQPDDKLLVAYRVLYRGHDDDYWLAPAVRRLNPNGSDDPSFAWWISQCDDVTRLTVRPDGKILVGSFLLTCLLTNGQQDPTWVRSRLDGPKGYCLAPGPVCCVAFQPDGKILVGGRFTAVDSHPPANLVRLHPNGATDESFLPPLFSTTEEDLSVRAVAVQPDGKLLIGGFFAAINGLPCEGLARLNPDGTLDATFTTGCGLLGEDRENGVSSIVIQSPDRALVAGSFEQYWGTPVNSLVRVLLTEAPLPPVLRAQAPGQALGFDFANPGGHSFTVLATTNLSLAESNWAVLGSPTNVGGGIWQFTDPSPATLPARFYRLRWP